MRPQYRWSAADIAVMSPWNNIQTKVYRQAHLLSRGLGKVGCYFCQTVRCVRPNGGDLISLALGKEAKNLRNAKHVLRMKPRLLLVVPCPGCSLLPACRQ